MSIISFDDGNLGKIISEASFILRKGGIVSYPTESFYALGVLASDEAAVQKLFALKRRPADKPLPVIVDDMDTLLSIVKCVPEQAGAYIEKYWPGPLTLIFDARETVAVLLTGGSGKVAVRIPGEGPALDLVRGLKLPVTATSANPSAHAPAETAEEVIHYFQKGIDLIIDGGKAPGGRPSTIIDVTVIPPRILREGSIVPA